MKFSDVAGNVEKMVWFKNVAQASRLPDLVPQASSLPLEELDKGKQAGRSLYDPDTTKRSEKEWYNVTGRSPTSWRGVHMPNGLRKAHHHLDLVVDRLYRANPFTSDEERLGHLFKLYEKMIAKEQLV